MKHLTANPLHGTQSIADTHKAPMDALLSLLIILLLAFGLVALYSASVGKIGVTGGWYYLQRQIMAIALGAFLCSMMMHLPYGALRWLSRYAVIIAITLLVIVLIPGVGRRVNGAVRWLGAGGFNFQPAELAKIAIIAYVADFVQRRPMIFRGRIIDQWPILLMLTLIALLLALQPDNGTIMVIFAVVGMMMILGGMKVRVWGTLLVIGLIAGFILYLASPYVQKRVDIFLDPLKDPRGDGWQLVNALIAMGRGGWTGVGLGDSVQKMRYLPEVHTDFILSMIGEELGFIGIAFFLLLYASLIMRLFVLTRHAAERADIYGTMLVYGVALWLSFQLIINVAVNLGWFPTKGLTLPMVSYGSSSMMMIGLALGCVFNVQRQHRPISPSVFLTRAVA